jgi:hypothetical protein
MSKCEPLVVSSSHDKSFLEMFVCSYVQHPAALSLLDVREGQACTFNSLRNWLPGAPPRLRVLQFGSYRAWDALHRAICPLVFRVAQAATEGDADCAATVTPGLCNIGDISSLPAGAKHAQ